MSRNKFESSIFSLADRISKELLKRKDRREQEQGKYTYQVKKIC